MEFLKNNNDSFEQLRKYEWAKSYNWDVIITTEDKTENSILPSFFPASTVSEDIASIESYQWSQGIETYRVPQQRNPLDISLTFYDTCDFRISSFMDYWINVKICNNGKYISPLDRSVRLLTLIRYATAGKTDPITGFKGQLESSRYLNSFRGKEYQPPKPVIVYRSSYWVYPTDKLVYSGDSDSGLATFTMSFAVAGMASSKGNSNSLNFNSDSTNGMSREYYTFDPKKDSSASRINFIDESLQLAREVLAGGPKVLFSKAARRFSSDFRYF